MQKAKELLKTLPKDGFVITKAGPYYKWFRKKNGKLIYIPKSEKMLAEKLATRKYLLALIKDKEHEIYALNMYLKHHESYQAKADQLLIEKPAYRELIQNYYQPTEEIAMKWGKQDYIRNEKYKEKLRQPTKIGILVRSKSEVTIADFLFDNHIPFHYEECVEINGSVIAPDFTIMNPKTGKVYYWEHFGAMDDEKYLSNQWWKLQNYLQEGVIMGGNLIVTFESEEYPLSYMKVKKTAEMYFDIL